MHLAGWSLSSSSRSSFVLLRYCEHFEKQLDIVVKDAWEVLIVCVWIVVLLLAGQELARLASRHLERLW